MIWTKAEQSRGSERKQQWQRMWSHQSEDFPPHVHSPGHENREGKSQIRKLHFEIHNYVCKRFYTKYYHTLSTLELSSHKTMQLEDSKPWRDVSLRGFLRGSWTLRKFAMLQSAAVQMSCIAWIRERPSTTRFPIDIPAHWRPTNENWYTMWQ